jgi:hypothetical protein
MLSFGSMLLETLSSSIDSVNLIKIYTDPNPLRIFFAQYTKFFFKETLHILVKNVIYKPGALDLSQLDLDRDSPSRHF